MTSRTLHPRRWANVVWVLCVFPPYLSKQQCWAGPLTQEEAGSERLRRLLKATQLAKGRGEMGTAQEQGGVSQGTGGFGSRGRS